MCVSISSPVSYLDTIQDTSDTYLPIRVGRRDQKVKKKSRFGDWKTGPLDPIESLWVGNKRIFFWVKQKLEKITIFSFLININAYFFLCVSVPFDRKRHRWLNIRLIHQRDLSPTFISMGGHTQGRLRRCWLVNQSQFVKRGVDILP